MEQMLLGVAKFGIVGRILYGMKMSWTCTTIPAGSVGSTLQNKSGTSPRLRQMWLESMNRIVLGSQVRLARSVSST